MGLAALPPLEAVTLCSEGWAAGPGSVARALELSTLPGEGGSDIFCSWHRVARCPQSNEVARPWVGIGLVTQEESLHGAELCAPPV